MNWTTGAGTARYWVLKLLIDEFEIGSVFFIQLTNHLITICYSDLLYETDVPPIATSPFCGVDNGLTDGYGNVSLQCADPSV